MHASFFNAGSIIRLAVFERVKAIVRLELRTLNRHDDAAKISAQCNKKIKLRNVGRIQFKMVLNNDDVEIIRWQYH